MASMLCGLYIKAVSGFLRMYNILLYMLPSIAPVRLVDEQHGNKGRVEVYMDGSWATVCGQNLDIDTADVLCKYMDFKSAIEVMKQSASQGSGRVLSVNCKGTSLKEDCIIKSSDCSHDWDASLVCQCM